MNLKTRITLGFLAVLALLLGTGGFAYYTVHRLDGSSRTILQDNFYSVQLGQQMLQALDALAADPAGAAGLPRLRQALAREAANVTEPGEQQLVDSLGAALARYAPAGLARRPAELPRLRGLTHRMVALNMAALTRKNERANRVAERAGHLLLACVALSALVALGFVLSVPEAAVSGLRKLSASIDHASRGDFTATIPVESTDEFGRVAQAFNRLLVHVSDSRSSYLAEVMTERNRLTSLVQTQDEALLLLDENQVVLVANAAAATLLGLPARQLLGQPVARLAAQSAVLAELLPHLPPAAPARAQPAAVPFVVAGPGAPAHYQLLVHAAVVFNPVLDQMEFVGTVVALRNVSEFKQLDEAKSGFLATVSHELKTPLSTINFHLKLLQDERMGPVNAEQSQLLASIKQENQRLLKITADLLDVARLEAGAIPLELRPLPVAELVAAATAPIELQLAPRHLQLTVDLPPDLPPVRADLEKSAWVLLNLLANAVRYSPEGGRIEVRAALTAAADAVRVSVLDHGPGIAPEHQEQIFRRFTQLPDAAGHHRGGSGLGLSISREFIGRQGGTLGVTSAPGQGSTFYFTLPVAAG